MSDTFINFEIDSKFCDSGFLENDTSLNASENTADLNANKISAAMTCDDYNNFSSSCKGISVEETINNTFQFENSASRVIDCDESFNNFSVCGAVCPNYNPITQWKGTKGIDLASDNELRFDNINENIMKDITKAPVFDSICQAYYSTSASKVADLSSNKSLQFEDSSRITDGLSNMSIASVRGAGCSDLNTRWIEFPSNNTLPLDNFNENWENFANESNFDAVCPANLSSSTSKCVDLSSNESLQFEDSSRITDGLSNKTYNNYSLVDFPVPKKPLIRLQNCFDASKACGYSLKPNELKNRIEIALNEKVDMSFEFDQKYFTWNAVYIKGSAHCKFQVHVDCVKDNCLLVEIHNLSGDTLAFHSIAKDIKNSISGVKDEFVESLFPVTSSMQPCEVLSDEDALDAIKVFKEMAAEPFVESQLEASRILCDLSEQESMQHILRDSGCIQILVNLATFGGTEWTRQHAILALVNLSSSPYCQAAIIDAGVLPALLTLATDGPYHSAAMRRGSARLLANISESLAVRVVTVLGRQALLKWFSSMDSFRDGILRDHAQRAKSFLSPVIAS